MNKHTPGPWAIDEWGNVIDAHGDRIRTIGFASAGFFGDHEEAKANTRLFYAAPDLLNASIKAFNLISELPPNDDRIEVANELSMAIEKAIGNEEPNEPLE